MNIAVVMNDGRCIILRASLFVTSIPGFRNCRAVTTDTGPEAGDRCTLSGECWHQILSGFPGDGATFYEAVKKTPEGSILADTVESLESLEFAVAQFFADSCKS